MKHSDFLSRLRACAAGVEMTLKQALDEIAAARKQAAPERLMTAMRYASLSQGKRFRPFLLVETARLFSRQQHETIFAATALECIHCYSLVHDDLPAMDDDAMRRGKASVHVAFDEATAILTGDGLLTLGFEMMADARAHSDPAMRALLCAKLAQAAGAGGMVGGQARDMEPHDTPLNIAQITQLQAMKTGALIAFACEAGALVGGASREQTQSLIAYGEAIGQAFQLSDDLLDVEVGCGALGKRTDKDAAAGKKTLVELHGRAGARARLKEMTVQAQDCLAPFGARAAVLAQAADFVAKRQA